MENQELLETIRAVRDLTAYSKQVFMQSMLTRNLAVSLFQSAKERETVVRGVEILCQADLEIFAPKEQEAFAQLSAVFVQSLQAMK